VVSKKLFECILKIMLFLVNSKKVLEIISDLKILKCSKVQKLKSSTVQELKAGGAFQSFQEERAQNWRIHITPFNKKHQTILGKGKMPNLREDHLHPVYEIV
jgi:uncharacterized protein with gpF-like domain